MNVGRVIGPFGVRGDAKVAAGEPRDFRSGLHVVAKLKSGEHHPLVVERAEIRERYVLIHFAGIDLPESVERLNGAMLDAAAEDLAPVEDGTHRWEDLIGMRVIDERLGDLGGVSEVRRYPQSDMLVVGERSLLVPMLGAYAMRIDASSRTIRVSLPPGFDEL